MVKIRLIYLLLLVFVSGCATGNVVYENVKEGPFKVTNIIDGDTIDLNNSERIRLSGINTPEIGECYYNEAKNELGNLILNNDVYLEKDMTNRDKYSRLLRYVYLNDLLVNSYLVQNGYAKVYDKYEYDTKKYEELKLVEEIAKSNNLGVWGCKDLKEGCLYVGSKNSDIYHKPECEWAKRIKPENLVCYHSEEEVKNLTPAKSC